MAISKEKKQEIKSDFEAGKLPITEIAKKHGVNTDSINRWAKAGKWSRKKRPQKPSPKPKAKPKKGRPTKYKPEYAKMATPLAMIGYSEEKIGEFFGVNRDTILQWKKRHPEFSGAILDGRAKATAKVVISLYQSAVGYSHPEDKIFNNNGVPLVVPTTKHYPPNFKSMKLWLTNKEPEYWKDKHEVAVEDRTIRLELPSVQKAENDEEFQRLVEEQLKAQSAEQS